MADVDMLIVGAGVTGIHQLYRAVEAGLTVHLVEAGDGVGGTWFWNRYPGARFDSESYTYGYLFSKELFEEWEWSEHFAEQPETERYLNHVVERFDLRRHMTFGRKVTEARWDDRAGAWIVTTDEGEQRTATYLVAATGVLSVPFIPDIAGRDDFRGIAHHTGRWPAEPVDFTGKRVAVIGTGSSGVQIVPVIAPTVQHLTVFQRSANWCTPLNNRPITAAEQAELRSTFADLCAVLDASPSGFLHPVNLAKGAEATPEERAAFFERMWASPGFSKLTSNYADLLFDAEVNQAWCEFLEAKIRALVGDPATADRLIPTHRYGQKRPPYVTGYYEAFNRPNVDLVDLRATPITRVTESGIETATGHVAVEIIVWATGFDFGTGALLGMGITGRDGTALADHWAEGPQTFLGLQTTGFPNLFFPGGPHAAAGNNPRYNGDQADFVIEVVTAAGGRVVEPTAEAEERWTAMVDTAARQAPFGELGQYFGTNIPGKPKRYLLNAGGRLKLHREFARVRDTGFAAFGLGAG